MNADPGAEQAIIAAVLDTGGRIYDDLRLTDDDFWHAAHGRIWKALSAYIATGRVLTWDTFASYLRQYNTLDTLGPTLIDCRGTSTVPQAAYPLADTLRLMTARRRVEAASTALAQLAGSPGDFTVDEITEMARGLVDRHTDRQAQRGSMHTILDGISDGLERWDRPDTNYLSTGWLDLDHKLAGGLRPGHLVVIGARPAVGKSFVATELARMVAGAGNACLMHSLEMSAEEVVNRIAASLSGVALATLTAGRATETDMDRLAGLVTRTADWPLVIDDRAHVTVSAIRGRARDLAREHRLRLIVVDYLQLITPQDRTVSREQQVGTTSRGLKLLARDLQVPVVALAQVNRQAAGRRERPQMHELRESGAIEADADEILMLHRNQEEAPDVLEVDVAKNRHGETGLIELAWQPDRGRVGNRLRRLP